MKLVDKMKKWLLENTGDRCEAHGILAVGQVGSQYLCENCFTDCGFDFKRYFINYR